MENNVNQRIKMLRTHLELSQNDLAKETGLTSVTISQIELGNANPTSKTLKKIIQATGVDRDWLLNGVGELKIEESVRVSDEEKNSSWSEKAFEAIKSKNEHLEQEIQFLRELLNKTISKVGTANFNEGFDLAELLGGQKLVEIVRAAA